jgi:pyruvate,water dikinase
MPAFDVICIDSPYQAVGSWQNRVFAVPPAMGIDYRIVNGYVYISGNPVTDPDKIAERAGYFQRAPATTTRTGPSSTGSGAPRWRR